MSAISSIFGASDGLYLKTLTIGKAGHATGKLQLTGTTSGVVTVTPADIAGTWTLTLPATAGTNKYVFTTNGSGVASWSQVDMAAGVTGVLPVANGGTAASSASITAFNNITGLTASGTTGTTSTNLVFSTSPTFVTPLLGTPTSGILTNCTGTASGLTAGNVTTNANLTGVVTSVGNTTSIASQTGTGTKFVVDTSPTLVTPVLGVATGTSLALTSTLSTSGVGPHAVGGGTAPQVQWYHLGSFTGSTLTYGYKMDSTLTGTAGNALFGMFLSPTLVEAGSGLHDQEFVFTTSGSITPGAATCGDAGSIDVRTIAAASGTTTASGIRIAGPSGASTNWAINVTSGASSLKTVFAALTNANAQDYVCFNTGTNELEQNATTCNLSTERVKDGITNQTPEDMLAVALKLEPVSFILKAHPELGPRLGLTAQRTEPIDTRLVTYFSGGPWKGELRGVDYDATSAIFSGAIQAQQRIIQMLDARIVAIAKQINA